MAPQRGQPVQYNTFHADGTPIASQAAQIIAVNADGTVDVVAYKETGATPGWLPPVTSVPYVEVGGTVGHAVAQEILLRSV